MEKKNFMKSKAAAVLLLAGMTVGLAGCTLEASIKNPVQMEDISAVSSRISVSGMESVKAVPDMAQIIFAVQTQSEKAEECQQENAKNLDATIQKLKELGVKEESIQTSSYNLNPIYDWDSSEQKITGYQMSTQLTVSDIPIDQAGTLISQSVTTGVNSITNVSYFCSDYDKQYQEALKKAISMAHAKAVSMAEAEGKTIVGAVSMTESGYNPNLRYSASTNDLLYAAETTAEKAVMDMGVMAGSVDIEASVDVVYQMK